MVKKSEKIYYKVELPDSTKESEQYQHAYITLFLTTPESEKEYGIHFSSEVCTLKYQRHMGRKNQPFETEGIWSQFYSESLKIDHAYDVSRVAPIFERMQKKVDALNKKGLTLLTCVPGDEYYQRTSMLKLIGACRVEYEDHSMRFIPVPV